MKHDVIYASDTILSNLEQQYSEALTRAESFPDGSVKRRSAYDDAEKIAAQINAWNERANRTP